jgi:hypothetical protein
MGTTTCPECGRTVTVRWRAVLDSTDGPIEHARVDCPAGHWLMLPVATLDRIRPVRTAAWRQINAYGIRIDYRTYDSPELGPWRGQHSVVTGKRGLREVHHDPYDLSQVFVRPPDGWVTAPWTHLPMVSAPFADGRPGAMPAGWPPRRARRHRRNRDRPGPLRAAHPRPERSGGPGQRPGRRPHPGRRRHPPTTPRRPAARRQQRQRESRRQRQRGGRPPGRDGDPVGRLRRRRPEVAMSPMHCPSEPARAMTRPAGTATAICRW